MPLNWVPSVFAESGLPAVADDVPLNTMRHGGPVVDGWPCIYKCEHGGICRECKRGLTIDHPHAVSASICIHGWCQRRCTHRTGHGGDGCCSGNGGDENVVHHYN